MKEYNYTTMEGYLLTKASVLMKRRLSVAIKKAGYDITIEQWTILNVLWKNEGLIQTEIAQKTFKDKTNLTRILDKMERDNLIVRNKNPKNRREYKITLTENGANIFSQLIPIAQNNNEILLQTLSSEERSLVVNAVKKIIDNLE